jgi:hypothetical protein
MIQDASNATPPYKSPHDIIDSMIFHAPVELISDRSFAGSSERKLISSSKR